MASADVSGKTLAGAADPGVRGAGRALRRARSIWCSCRSCSTSATTRRRRQRPGGRSPRTARSSPAPGCRSSRVRSARRRGTTDLVRYAFLTLRGYLQGGIISAHIADIIDDAVPRRLLVEGVAAAIQSEAERRGIEISRALSGARARPCSPRRRAGPTGRCGWARRCGCDPSPRSSKSEMSGQLASASAVARALPVMSRSP